MSRTEPTDYHPRKRPRGGRAIQGRGQMIPVRIFGIACSPRHGNTEILVNEALKAAKEMPGVETEFYSIVGKEISPCNSCYRCMNAKKEDPCPAIKDDFKDVYPRFFAADGL